MQLSVVGTDGNVTRWSEVERSWDSSWSFVPAWKSCLRSLLSVSFDSNTACVCFFWNTFDPDIEKRGKFERAEPDCGLSPDFVATWQQILGGGVDALPSC